MHNQGLEALGGVDFKETADLFDAVLSRGVDVLHLCAGGWAFSCWRQGFGQFQIGGIIAFGGEGDGIFT